MSALTSHQRKGLKRFPEGWNTVPSIEKAGVPKNLIIALQSKGAVTFRGDAANKEYSVNKLYVG
jgi:hypothetical protein